MKSIVKFIIPIALIIPFLLILLISPNQDEYLSRFDEDQYVEVAVFDVPDGNQTDFSYISSLPFNIRYENKNIDQVRVLVNKSLLRSNGYIRDNLDVNFVTDPENKYASLEIKIPGHLFYFRGESFNIVNLFENYKNLFNEGRYPLILIQTPENYRFTSGMERFSG